MPRVKEFESSKVPGAKYSLNVVGRALRHRVELTLAEPRHQQRMLMDEWRAIAVDPLTKSLRKEDTLSPEEIEKLDRINIKSALLHDTIRLTYAQTLLSKFSIPGDKYTDVKTPTDLFEFGPELLAEEVMASADDMWRMPEEKRGNSDSPSSSPGAADGATNDTTAAPASETSSTESATAS